MSDTPEKIVRAPRPGSEGFGDLPPAAAPAAALPSGMISPASFEKEQQAQRFAIPMKDKFGLVVDPTWGERSDGDLVFYMVALTPEREEKAAASAGMGQNFQAVFAEMVTLSVAMIGEVKTRGRRDYITDWLKQLGPRGRKYVDAAYNRMSSVAEADLNTFLDGGAPVTI